MPLPTMDPRANRPRCPAFRMSEHQHHHPIPSFRTNYQFDPSQNPHPWWQPLPPPHHQRWIPDPAYHPSPPVMPPNSGQIGQPPYTPSSGPTYNAHPTPPFDYRQPMMSLQRIGGTAPIQHSQGNFSVSANQSQNVQAQPQANGQASGGGAGSFNTNGTLPPLNPMASNANQTRHFPFNQTSRPAQSGRNSPPPFVRQTSITTNMSAPEVQTSSRLSEADNSHSDSPSPHRSAIADAGSEDTTSESRRSGRNRRGFPRLPSSDSGSSSDDDYSDRDAIAMSLLDAATHSAPGTEDRMRAHQIMRGAVSNKRVASKKALTSLESVAISDLPKSERTCVICYNDYGVETPEGISEIPLRLPKCKHVFGDHCIKKWFEESDSCPYCRDKVPSEPQYRQVMTAANMYRFLRQQQFRNLERDQRGESDSPSRAHGSSLESYHASLASSPYADFEYSALGGPAYRRADGSSGFSSRNAAWHGSPERHSPLPFAEVSENRRRARSHRGSLRFPAGRPHFAAPPAGSSSQAQQYPWFNPRQPQPHSHNHRHSSSASNPSAGLRAMADASHPIGFQQIGGPSESYLNPLNMGNSGTPEDYQNHSLPHMRPQHASPLSPTYAGPEVYMSNADDSIFGGPGPHSSM